MFGNAVPVRRLAPPRDDGFRPAEELVRDDNPRPAISLGPRSPELVDHESNGSRIGFDNTTGLAYRYYNDASGGVQMLKGASIADTEQEWSFSCDVDQMTDARSCSITHQQLFIEYAEGGRLREICIIGHDFPGRTGAIRIDTAEPIRVPTSGCLVGDSARSVAARLRGAERVVTRRVEWPYDYYRDSASDYARGFRLADEFIRWWMTNREPVAFANAEATLSARSTLAVTGYDLVTLQASR